MNLSILNNQNQIMNIWESSEDLKQIKEIYGKSLSSGEFNTLVQMGKATGLNPFLKEIWAVKYGETAAQIFIGRDGYRKSAQRHPLYDYHITDAVYSNDEFYVVNAEVKHKYTLTNRGQLIGAYCLAQRKGSSRPTYLFAELKEYSTGKSLWNQQTGKPATMIKKVAEAQGLRAAFQELFSGTYSEYETWIPAEDSSNQLLTNKPGTGVSGLKEKLGLTKKTESITHDDESGEVIEDAVVSTPLESVDPETIKFLLESASTTRELLEAVNLTKSLPEEHKQELRDIYKKRSSEINKKLKESSDD